MKEEEILDAPEEIETTLKNPVGYGILSIIFLCLLTILITILFNEYSSYLVFSKPVLLFPFLLLSINCVLFFFIKSTRYYNQKLIKVIPPTALILFFAITLHNFLYDILLSRELPNIWPIDWSLNFYLLGSCFMWGWFYSFGICIWLKFPRGKWVLILINIGFLLFDFSYEYLNYE